MNVVQAKPASSHGRLIQADWILLPRPWLTVDEGSISRDETIELAGGFPHDCEAVSFTRGVIFARGSVRFGDQSVQLTYWHQVAGLTGIRSVGGRADDCSRL